MSIATVVVTEAQYSVVITENGIATTVVTAPTTVNVAVSTPGPIGPVGPGVPVGGAAGELLTKSSATNYDTAWTSTAGKADGDVLTWVAANNRWEATAPIAGVTDIAETAQVISADYVITTGKNGISVGPVEVAYGYTVTVPAGAVWLIAD